MTKEQIETTTKVLDILALTIQFSGAWLMYRNSPVNEMPWAPTFDDTDMYQKRFKKKNNKLKVGFLILSIGILVSIGSLIIHDFNK